MEDPNLLQPGPALSDLLETVVEVLGSFDSRLSEIELKLEKGSS